MPQQSHKMGLSNNTISCSTLSKEGATLQTTSHRNQPQILSQEQAILLTVSSSSKTLRHHRFKYLKFTDKIIRATTTNTTKWARCIQIIKEEHLGQPPRPTVFSTVSLVNHTRRSKVDQSSQQCLRLTKINRSSNSIRTKCQRPIYIKMLLMVVILKMITIYSYGKILKTSRLASLMSRTNLKVVSSMDNITMAGSCKTAIPTLPASKRSPLDLPMLVKLHCIRV